MPMSAVPQLGLHVASVTVGASERRSVGASERRSVGASILGAASFSAKVEPENPARSACAGASMHDTRGGTGCGTRLLHGANGGCQWQAGRADVPARVASMAAGPCMVRGMAASVAVGLCMVHGAGRRLAMGPCMVREVAATRWAGLCMVHGCTASVAVGPCMAHGRTASRETAPFSAIYENRS